MLQAKPEERVSDEDPGEREGRRRSRVVDNQSEDNKREGKKDKDKKQEGVVTLVRTRAEEAERGKSQDPS